MDQARGVPPGPSVRPVAGAAGAEGSPPPVRVLPVAPGQTLQATVAQVLGDGRVLLGWRGSLFEAATRLQLTPGRSYEFTVAAAGETVVLSTARALAPPEARAAAAAGLLGLPPAELGHLLQRFADSLGAGLAKEPAIPPASGGRTADSPRPSAFFLQPAGERAPSAEQLADLQKRLGHDQEARVLRLQQRPPAVRAREIALLQTSAKAEALQVLENASAGDPQRRAAAELVSGLNRIEADNARRAEQGAPTWLPLPVAAGGPLRDARMFLLAEPAPEGGENAATGQRRFTVVLLLDLSKLGELRVDVSVTGRSIAATFLPVRPATTQLLVGAMPVLREALRTAGLEPGRLEVRNAPEARLPVADLVAFPQGREGLVDLHA